MTSHHPAAVRAKPFPTRRDHARFYPGDGIAKPEGNGGTGWPWLALAAEMAGIPGADPPGTAWPPLISSQTQDRDDRAVHAGRTFSLATLQRWGVTERGDDIATVVSELLTNALRHAVPGLSQASRSWPVQLGLLHSGTSVLCAVADPSSSAPVLRKPHGLAENGRGLLVVSALSDNWGYTACATPCGMGKVVWAMFTTPHRAQPARPDRPSPAPDRAASGPAGPDRAASAPSG